MRCVSGARLHHRGLFTVALALLALAAADPVARAQDEPPPLEIPPAETRIDEAPAAVVSSGDARFGFSAPGSLTATFQCRLDDDDPLAWSNCASPQEYSGLADGRHRFEVRALDPLPDETPATVEWTVDTVAPTVAVTSGPPALTTDTEARFAYSSDDPDARLECSLDAPGTWQPCAASYGVAEGAHVLQVRATDAAGNAGAATHGWTVDTTAPTAAIDLGTSGVVSSGAAAFSFSSDDADAAFRCSLDGAAAEPCTSPTRYTGLADGSHTFSVFAVDAAGNEGEPASAAWRVVTPPPEVPFLPPPPQPSPPAEDQEPAAQQPAPDTRVPRRRVTHVSDERTRTWWAHVRRDSAVYARPSRKARRVGRVGRFTYYGFDDIVVVLKRVGRWTRVRYSGLGRRTGWVWTGALSRPRLIRTSVVIDRKRFTLTAYRKGKRVFRSRVGVGAKESPTPRGRFFMRERLVPREKDGIYGVLAWGTSTYSRYRTDWPGGGQVGIHGTNEPGLIPGRISNGCIRLRNRSIRRLDRIVRKGTPLLIR